MLGSLALSQRVNRHLPSSLTYSLFVLGEFIRINAPSSLAQPLKETIDRLSAIPSTRQDIYKLCHPTLPFFSLDSLKHLQDGDRLSSDDAALHRPLLPPNFSQGVNIPPNGNMVDHPAGSLPSIHPAILIRGGRGGAGNYRLVEPPPAQTLVSSAASSSDRSCSTFSKSSFRSSSSGMFATGRGGAGNMHFASERAMFRFDEELAQERRRYQAPAPIYHIGRGGAANFVVPPRREELNARSSIESRDSARDTSSEDGLAGARWAIWSKLRGALVPS